MGDSVPNKEAERTGTKSGAGVRAAWIAVGAARAHAASLHACAAWDALIHAWKSMSAAADKARDSVGALGGAVGSDHAIDTQALVAGAAVMAKGLAEMKEARAAFGVAAKRSRAEASERDLAAKAYRTAGAAKAARRQRIRAATARKRGDDVDTWKSNAAHKAAVLADAMDAWKKDIATFASAGFWDGDRTAWAVLHASMRARIDNDRKRWAWIADKAGIAGAMASDRLVRAEAVAKRTARAAGMVREKGGKGSVMDGAAQHAEAADAWLAATMAVEQLSRG